MLLVEIDRNLRVFMKISYIYISKHKEKATTQGTRVSIMETLSLFIFLSWRKKVRRRLFSIDHVDITRGWTLEKL